MQLSNHSKTVIGGDVVGEKMNVIDSAADLDSEAKRRLDGKLEKLNKEAKSCPELK